MSLLDTYRDFVENDDKGERAAFEAAMLQRIEKQGFKMGDLFYEVYKCQQAIANLQCAFDCYVEVNSKKKGAK